jgi:uncharacterized membrane protein YphA (DoxX/SURF4 family)
MCKTVALALLASFVDCRRWRAADAQPQSQKSSALRTLLLAQSPLRTRSFQARPTHTRHPAAKMQLVETLPEAIQPVVSKLIELEFLEEEEGELVISQDLEKELTALAFSFMRIAVAAVMFHHGQENLLDPAVFTKYTIDKYFAFLPGPHLNWAVAAGSTELIGAALLGLGIFSRVSALSLSVVMAGAIWYSKITNKGFEGFPGFELGGLSSTMKYKVYSFHNYGFETPLLYMGIFLLIAATGPGKYSLAQRLGWNDDNSLLGKLKQ